MATREGAHVLAPVVRRRRARRTAPIPLPAPDVVVTTSGRVPLWKVLAGLAAAAAFVPLVYELVTNEDLRDFVVLLGVVALLARLRSAVRRPGAERGTRLSVRRVHHRHR